MNSMLEDLLLRRRFRRKSDRSTRYLVVFFLILILAGTALLCLPAASRNGRSCGFLTALFTATSASCVTGLSPVDTWSQWSGLGQGVLLLLIQVGGLGYMTIVSLLYFLLRRRIGLQDRLILQQALALNELDGVLKLLRLVVAGTLLVEGCGAAVLTVRFLGEMPFGKALWYGVFHAVSAFCNAGFDLMGTFVPGSSLTGYAADPVVLVTIMALITLGGLGFFVWNDLLIHRFSWKRLSVHTRLVLVTSCALVLLGALATLALEWGNPGTLGPMSVGQKLLAALFQSVTTRTAGFFAVDQGALSGSGKLVSILLMLVGGSSGSTAGGVKTVTVALLFLTAFRVLRNRKELVVFGREIPQDQVNSALGITLLVSMLGLLGGILLSAMNGVSLGDAIYEAVSAICTVGLSAGITASLNAGSKLLLILYMYFGRVGIMTISFAFMTRAPEANAISRPETRVLIG